MIKSYYLCILLWIELVQVKKSNSDILLIHIIDSIFLRDISSIIRQKFDQEKPE